MRTLNQSRMCDKREGNELNQNTEKPLMYFIVIFGLILAIFLRSQSYDFDAIADTGAPSGAE